MSKNRKDEPVYQEMRSLAPYFLIISGIYLCVLIGLCFYNGFDYTLPLGGLYGCLLAVLSFFLLGKAAQSAVMKKEKKAESFMRAMYGARYLGLFVMLALGALAPFINLVASVVPLFFVRAAIMIRAIKTKEE